MRRWYTKTHEWVEVADGTATMGISEHAQELLGDIVYLELPEVGKKFEQGAEVGVIESVKAASDLYAPLAGSVLALNEAAINNPALINEDPYDKGWLIKLSISHEDGLSQLLDEKQYQAQIAEDHD